MSSPIPSRAWLPGLLAACLCSLASAQCAGGDDHFEENDTCAGASLISAGFHPSLHVVRTTDLDYYLVSVPDGHQAEIEVFFAHANGDIDVRVFDATCTNVLTSSNSVTNNELVTVANTSGVLQNYVLEVLLWDDPSNADCTDYDLDLAINPIPVCGLDDMFEENDDCASRAMIPPGTYLDLHTKKKALDPDFFGVTVPAGEAMTATITFLGASADADLRLWDEGCNVVLDSSTGTTGTEVVTWSNSTGLPTTVTVETFVWSGAGSDCVEYDMVIDVTSDPCNSADDALEDNDDCATAIGGQVGFHPNLYVHKADSDFFRFRLDPGERLDVLAEFEHAAGDIDLYLYDRAVSCGTGAIVTSTSLDDDEGFSHLNTTGVLQRVVVEVQVWTGSPVDCNHYDLNITLTPAGIGEGYCGPAVPNSLGQSATIHAEGSELLVAQDLTLVASSLPPGESVLFLSSLSDGLATPPTTIGVVCLGSPIGRFRSSLQPATPAGTASFVVDLMNVPNGPGNQAAVLGDSWHFQAWYRDAGSSNLTDAVRVTFQ